MDEISVTTNHALYTFTEIRHAIKYLLNGLHGKIGVTPIQLLEKRDLGVRRQIHILRTVGHELHQSALNHSPWGSDFGYPEMPRLAYLALRAQIHFVYLKPYTEEFNN
jgi:hypothetical protein